MARNMLYSAFSAGLLLCVISHTANAQITSLDDTTSPPIPGVGHDYIKLFGETVNPANGSVSLRIDLPMPKGRGLNVPFAILYSSSGVEHVVGLTNGGGAWGTDTGQASGSGWSYSVPTLTLVQGINSQSVQGPPPQTFTCYYYYSYAMRDWSGAAHPFVLYEPQNVQDGNCSQNTGFASAPVLTSSEDFFSAITTPLNNPFFPNPVTVVGPDGTVYQFTSLHTDTANNYFSYWSTASSIEDRNGNVVTSSLGQGTNNIISGTVTDEVGHQVTVSALSSGSNTVSVPGLSAYTQNWASFPWSLTVGSMAAPSSCNYGIAPTSGTNYVVQTLTLPNGKSFQFQYDATYGLLSQIKYPSGGYVSYTWSLNKKSEVVNVPAAANSGFGSCYQIYDSPAIATRVVSYDGVNVAETQTFKYTTTWSSTAPVWTTKTTTITTSDNLGNKSFITTYTYKPTSNSQFVFNLPAEVNVTYQDFSGAVLKTVTKSWFDVNLLACQVQTLDNGLTSGELYSYGSGGQMTDKKEYDFGSGISSSCQPPSGAPTRETITTYQQFPATPIYPSTPSILDHPCKTIINDNGSQAAETDDFYDNGTSLCGAAGTPSVTSVTAINHDETNYGASSTSPRGNLTQTTRLLTGGTSPVTTYSYDETGQVLSVTDPCGNSSCSDVTGLSHTTSFSYVDNFLSGSGTPPGNTNAYLTTITHPIINGITQHQYFQYAYSDGQLTQSQDDNNKTASVGTNYLYNDSLRRLTETDYPDGGQTKLAYNDAGPKPTVTACKLINGTAGATCSASSPPSGWLVSLSQMDGLGHVIQTQLPSDPDGNDLVDITYDGLGRIFTRSNPHRSSASITDGTTTYTYDSLGRTTKVAEPDGSAVTTVYSGKQTTVTDEIGNQRSSTTDALGRLTDVFEAPNVSSYNFVSHYQYNALDDLICAVQKGTDTTMFTSCSASPATWRPRSFMYDSLSRLTSASNPESGTVTYSYDANGNLATKVALSPNQPSTGTAKVTTSYTYDALNRMISKGYTDAYAPPNPLTLGAIYGYDGKAITGCPTQTPPGDTDSNAIGRRTSMCDGSGATNWTHDSMGRILQERRTIGSASGKNDTDAYNLDGSVASITSLGFQVSYTYSGAGRALSATGINNYVQSNSAVYAPFGGLVTAKLGAKPILLTNAYNSRLQPLLISAAGAASIISLCYDFHLIQVPQNNTTPCTPPAGSGDNGNVFQIINNRDNNRTQNFLYDPLNRISQAYTSGPNWGETFGPTATNPGVQPTSSGIDAWGNLSNRSGVTGKSLHEGLSCTVNTKNQLGSCSLFYDPAGNMTSNAGNGYFYDADNRLTAAGGMSYIYDGDGKRVEKCTEGTDTHGNPQPGTCAASATGTLYWGVAGGETSTETDLAGNVVENYVYFNGARIARKDFSTGVLHFYFSDHLGTHSLITDNNGTMPPQEESDYYPYGGEIPISGSDINHYKFTGKERDIESGLDYFGARYNTSSVARFMSPDPLGGMKIDPQTLNKYAYVRNNPLNLIDPRGLYACKDDNNHCKSDQDVAFEKARQLDLKSKDPNVVRAAKAYGDPTKDGPGGNKVSVGFSADLDKKGEGGDTTSIVGGADAQGHLYAQSDVTISSKLSGSDLDAAVGHEGSHVADAQDVVSSITSTDGGQTFKIGQNITRYQSEQRAYAVSDSILRSENTSQRFGCGLSDCALGTSLSMRGQLGDTVDRVLANSPLYRSNGRPLSPSNQGGSVVNGLVPQ